MPPSGGMGMGIDRLLMAITGLGIRETILLPAREVTWRHERPEAARRREEEARRLVAAHRVWIVVGGVGLYLVITGLAGVIAKG